MYLSIDQIETIQLDHTSRCNLLCPQCARTEEINVNPKLPMRDLTIQDYERIFDPFVGRDVRILHCGNYGDVIASPTFDETLDWCISKGFGSFNIHTNGSGRKPEWWAQLAAKIGNRSVVTFSVDGLSDTNHIYRVNSRFDKIRENMEAFAAAGGYAKWAFIVFSHNQHQVEEAERMAREIGIREFITKQTSRFVTTKDGFNETVSGKNTVVRVNDGNKNVETYKKIVEEYGSFDSYTKATKVSCKYKKNQMVYIDFDMRVWPCCWTGAPTYFFVENAQTIDLANLYDRYGSEFNSLRHFSWEDILEGDWFGSGLERSWDDASERLYVCGRTCGEKYSFTPQRDVKVID